MRITRKTPKKKNGGGWDQHIVASQSNDARRFSYLIDDIGAEAFPSSKFFGWPNN